VRGCAVGHHRCHTHGQNSPKAYYLTCVRARLQAMRRPAGFLQSALMVLLMHGAAIGATQHSELVAEQLPDQVWHTPTALQLHTHFTLPSDCGAFGSGVCREVLDVDGAVRRQNLCAEANHAASIRGRAGGGAQGVLRGARLGKASHHTWVGGR
jgi:hypothetical protein